MTPVNDFFVDLSCAEVEDAHAAYVWGGLAPGDRARVDRHRRQCAACDQRLLASERVVSELDQAHPKVAPPPELRERVLEATARLAAEPTPITARRADRAAWRGPFVTGLTTGVVGALAAAALAVLLFLRPEALGVLTGRQSQFGPGPLNQAPGQPGLNVPGLSNPAATDRLLVLRPSAGDGRGLLAYDAQTRRGVLLLEGVPSATGGSQYTVWLIQGSQRVPLGTLGVDDRGVGAFVLPDPLPLDRPERIEIVQTSTSPDATPVVLSADF
jgi:hypothetical protein